MALNQKAKERKEKLASSTKLLPLLGLRERVVEAEKILCKSFIRLINSFFIIPKL